MVRNEQKPQNIEGLGRGFESLTVLYFRDFYFSCFSFSFFLHFIITIDYSPITNRFNFHFLLTATAMTSQQQTTKKLAEHFAESSSSSEAEKKRALVALEKQFARQSEAEGVLLLTMNL